MDAIISERPFAIGGCLLPGDLNDGMIVLAPVRVEMIPLEPDWFGRHLPVCLRAEQSVLPHCHGVLVDPVAT